MPTARNLKQQMGFVKGMSRLIEALKEIDAAHFMSLASKKEQKFAEYEEILQNFISMTHSVSDVLRSHHPLLFSRSACSCVVVLTSDAGFMGKLNTNICRETVTLVEDLDEAECVVLGKKGQVRLRYLDAKITPFPSITETRRYEQVIELKDYVVKQRLEGNVGDVYLVSPRSYGFGKQEVVTVKLLPAIDMFKQKTVIKVEKWQEICVESKFEKIVEYLIETWLVEKLYDAAFESKLAEYSARTMHLEGSLDYLKAEIKKLSLQYNKTRQSETDTGLRETFSSLMGIST